jgi:hypothetical protein
MKPFNLSVRGRLVGAALIALILGALPAVAQQSNASAAAYGLGGNYLARARGVNAVAWNPANLGLAGNPGFSFQALAFNLTSGIDPIDLSDFKEYDGQLITTTVKEQWLQKVIEKQGETGNADLGASWLGLSTGPFAFQVSTSGYATGTLNPDAVEAILFGNAGRTGAVRSFNFTGSNMRAGAFTTVAGSYGRGIGSAAPGAGQMAVGVTAKYVVGHGVLIARDNGSGTTPDAIELDFPAVHVNTEEGGASAGTGVGFDLGFAWQRGTATTIGATVTNVVNTFKWDESKLQYRPGTALFDGDNQETNFDTTAYASAPAVLRDAITNNKFKPTLAVGLAHELNDRITLTADLRQQLTDDDAIQIGPKSQLGGGAELRFIPVLPIRVGASYVTGGFGLSAGVGLRILGVEIGVAGMLRDRDEGKENGLFISVLSVR